jgi:peptidoglycan hydrolase CwlO-like protein
MQHRASATIVAFLIGSSIAAASGTNPISKVVAMISDLQQKIIKEGESAHKVYTEFAEMCEDRAGEIHNEIKTGKSEIKQLEAVIDKANSDITVLESQISDFAAAISESDSDLQKATAIRSKESADFKAEEKELMSTVSTIERSILIVEKEMEKGGSFAQVKGLNSVAGALQAMVEAHSVNTADGAKLMALMQSSSESDDESDEDEDAPGAPDPAAYKSQSGTIVDTLEGLLAKAQKQLEDARNAEAQASNAYQLQKQSLEDKISFSKRELSEAKKSLAATSEKKATATGDLEGTKKSVVEDKKDLGALHHECLTEATSYEESTASRGEELKALNEAKKLIESTTGAAAEQTYLTQTSFVQVAAKTRVKAASEETLQAVSMVRRLAMSQNSRALVQFASHLERVASSSNQDPFAKVRSLISGMIEQLMDEADSEASKKAYCDKEMTMTEKNKDDKDSQIEQLTTQVDVMTAQSKKTKGQVALLDKESGELKRNQAQMDQLRMEEKALYEKNKPELEQGIKGMKTALKVLREYYAKDDKAHDESGGGAGIIGLLEVAESDFSKGLAEVEAEESAGIQAYKKASNENQVSVAAKTQDSKYKTKEYLNLDKTVSELKTDKSGVVDELSAVVQYFAGIKKQCVAAPLPYEERVKRRNKEIGGLKDALATLEGDAVLLQRSAVHRTLRGAAILHPSA